MDVPINTCKRLFNLVSQLSISSEGVRTYHFHNGTKINFHSNNQQAASFCDEAFLSHATIDTAFSINADWHVKFIVAQTSDLKEEVADILNNINPEKEYIGKLAENNTDFFMQNDSINNNNGIVFIEPHTHEIQIITSMDFSNPFLFGMRVIRNLPMIDCLNQGFLLFHGACVSKQHKGVAFIGHKRAGKTSTLFNCILGGFDFVSNDKIFLSPLREKGGCKVLGFPISIAARLDSIQHFFKDHKMFMQRYQYIQSNNYEKRLRLPIEEFLQYTKTQIVKKAELKHIIFPSFSKELKDSILQQKTEVEKIQEILLQNCLTSVDPQQLYWDRLLKRRTNMHETIKEIIATCTFWSLEQSSKTNPSSLKKISNLLTGYSSNTW